MMEGETLDFGDSPAAGLGDDSILLEHGDSQLSLDAGEYFE